MRGTVGLGFVLPALLLVAALAGGCVSTQERFEKGRALEQRGRPDAALEQYVRVLRREPAWPEARERALAAGRQVADLHLEAARAAEAAGRYEAAVRSLARLEEVRTTLARVGVELPPPEGYEAYVRAVTDEAAAEVIAAAEAAEAAGEWREALRGYERAAERYATRADQREALLAARARVFVRWGADELAGGRGRAAHERAGRALALLPVEHPLADEARGLQAEALEVGTRYVAFLPLEAAADVAGVRPGLVRRLDDVLRYDYWSRPPEFVASLDPAEAHRAMRRLQFDRGPLSPREASELGRAMGADYVVVLALDELAREETNRRVERRAVRTRGRAPVDTAFVAERLRAELRAEISYRIVDAATRVVVDEGEVRGAAAAEIERGRYEGDYRDLRLGRRDLALFDPERLDEAERRIEDELVEELAERAAREAYEGIVRRIP